jgi:hypothetical protein
VRDHHLTQFFIEPHTTVVQHSSISSYVSQYFAALCVLEFLNLNLYRYVLVSPTPQTPTWETKTFSGKSIEIFPLCVALAAGNLPSA